jgi:hypothetical protein
MAMDDAPIDGSPGRGRPTKRTPDARQKVLEAIKKGLPIKVACGLSGISEDTFARWNKDDPDFALAVAQAEATPIAESVDTIRGAGRDDWRASSWWLERRHADLFAPPSQQWTQALHIQNTTNLGLTAVEIQDLIRRNQPQLDRLLNGKPLLPPDDQDQG